MNSMEMQYLLDTLTNEDNLKSVREKAMEFYKMHDDDK